MKEFSCGQVVPGCEAKFSAESEQELLQQVATHAREDHGMEEIPSGLVDQVRAGIVER